MAAKFLLTFYFQVFKYGPEDARMVVGSLKKNADGSSTIDKDNVCYDTDHAFVFLENNCTEVRHSVISHAASAGKQHSAYRSSTSCVTRRS